MNTTTTNTPAPVNLNAQHKWEGEKCTCGHTHTLHANGKGICFAPNCSCDAFHLKSLVDQPIG